MGVLALAVATLCLAQEVENPFGLMIGARGLGVEKRVALLKDLGAVWFRPNSLIADGSRRAWDEAEAASRAGFRLVLTVRANGGAQEPTSPPKDMKAYKEALAAILDRFKPAVLVVENEENSRLFYTGTPADYAGQLKAAVEVAHARGLKVANGGPVSALVCLLVYADYVDRGEKDKARSFAERAFDSDERRLPDGAKAREQIEKGRELLRVYKESGIDYLNFHWYVADPGALEEACAFLKARTGLPLIANEIGQHETRPETVRALMSKVLDLRLPIAVWYSIDSPKAKALIEGDGTLRENGRAFRDFVRAKFGK